MKTLGDAFILMLLLFLMSCSQEIRVKNWVNYPVKLSKLTDLDSLKHSPDVVNFIGSQITNFHRFDEDIRIQGRHENRPAWWGDTKGCFEVDGGARVVISDFNFKGIPDSISLIHVKSGHLVLENCDFNSGESWAIEVDSAAVLELYNVHFSDFRQGAINVRGGVVRIFESHFEGIGKRAVYASAGDLFEIHNSNIRNTMGSALELNAVNEVWLDSVRIVDSFQDGIVINGCDYVLLNATEVRENGRHGLSINDANICGILNVSALGNLVKGIQSISVDTLRILNSQFVGNGESGGSITESLHSHLAGIQVGHNGGRGLVFSKGGEVRINKSSFQANPGVALGIDSLNLIDLQQVSLVNNGSGLTASGFDSLDVKQSLFSRNRGKSFDSRRGNHIYFSENLVKQNQSGIVIHDILRVHLDSNRVEANTFGNNIQSVSSLKLNDNDWVSNESAAYFSHIGSMSSQRDSWLLNLDTGLEVFSARELLISEATIRNNRKGVLLNEVSLRLETSSIDSCRDVGLKLMNSDGILDQVEFQHNGTAVQLDEGSQSKVTQSQFLFNEIALMAEASVSLTISFSNIYDSRRGIVLGNYAQAEILSNQFKKIDGHAVELRGPHLQSLLFRQNVVSKTGGIIDSKVGSGEIHIRSNTFASNLGGITASDNSLGILDHNIFSHTPWINPRLMKDEDQFKANCLFPSAEVEVSEANQPLNLHADPELGQNYYLLPGSPCLNGGENGMLIGALGAVPIARPTLQP